ncbi:MAG: TetR/AcrR family transcriptional regulator [Acidimicrobiia bacterium]|nr:TetR/AcrR family transcriptional regulator [Acidimicrobiia bacterium]
MSRPARFSEDQILDVSRGLVVQSGPMALTMTAVARLLGAPSGSLYHRFPGRDTLAAALWLRGVRRFQSGYLAKLGNPDPLIAALGAASHVVTWSRANLGDARLLMQFRSSDLVHGPWPKTLRDENLRLQHQLENGIRGLQAAFGAIEPAWRHRVSYAVIDVPYAAVRPALLAGQPPPDSTDVLVAETVEHTLKPLVAATGRENRDDETG